MRASAYHRKSGPRPSFLGAGTGRPGRRVPGGNRPTLHPRAEHLSALAQPQDRHAWRLRLLGSTQRPAKNRSGPERLHVTLRIIWPRICPLFGIIVREFYSAEDLGFLDRICGIIERLEDVHQRTLARSALVRTCMKKQSRGKLRVAAIPRLALRHLFS